MQQATVVFWISGFTLAMSCKDGTKQENLYDNVMEVVFFPRKDCCAQAAWRPAGQGHQTTARKLKVSCLHRGLQSRDCLQARHVGASQNLSL